MKPYNVGQLLFVEKSPFHAALSPAQTKEKCVHCKHCHPCPAGLDIDLIHKYYDSVKLGNKLGDTLAKHYLTLIKRTYIRPIIDNPPAV